MNDHDGERLPAGVLRVERQAYHGKHYEVPVFDPADPLVLCPRPDRKCGPRPP
jgi:hypothetical protein